MEKEAERRERGGEIGEKKRGKWRSIIMSEAYKNLFLSNSVV
jgi:hypothetical protein